MKLVFTPFSIVLGLAMGMVGRKIFEAIWGVFDDEEAPDAKHRDVPYVKLVLALLLQGAVFRLVRGLTDHGLRHGFARLTGSWPGEEEPEPK